MPNDHQKKMAESGYRLPDEFYVEPTPKQQSAEEKSGDGGAAMSEQEPKTDTGYQGELKSQAEAQQEAQEQAAARRTVDPKTGLTDAEAIEAQIPGPLESENAPKSAEAPKENKSSKKGK